MPTDTNIATAIIPGRQQGSFVSSLGPASVSRHAEEMSAAGKPDADGGRQDLSVREQELPPEEKTVEEEKVKQAVSDINAYVQNLQRDLQFKVDTELGRTIISVVDSETKQVIRQIPREDVVERARFLEERANADGSPEGLLLQVKI
jgi:flagellar protein FlaG